MSAKDKTYRKMKKQLEPFQKELHEANYNIARDMLRVIRGVFEDTHPSLAAYCSKKWAIKWGRTYDPEYFIRRDKKKKYRTPTRRL
jgi:hypothetical protein